MRIPALVLRDGDREELERRAASRTYGVRDVQRAELVLAGAADVSNREIGRRIGMHYNQVAVWRRRYEEFGLAGLVDEERSGRPVVYGHDDVLRLVKTVTEPPPDTATRWTMEALAGKMVEHGVPISASQVWRICRSLDLKPWQTESWMTSHDPDFWEKAGDVCGLYLNPPDNVVVWSVDEKTGIQAKYRTYPERRAAPGRPARREFEYVRNGTVSIVAALQVATGQVVVEPINRNDAATFTGFLHRLDQSIAPHLNIHIVMDNGSSHTARSTRAWIAAHPRISVTYTPKHASWLDMAELWFSVLTRALLRRGEFTSRADLAEKITDFAIRYNRTAKPWQWAYDARADHERYRARHSGENHGATTRQPATVRTRSHAA